LKKALEKGYVVQRIYEVWNFDETEHYDPKTKTGGLFTDYVNTFLKMKQEAGGWQEWCQSENDKWRYIRDYHEKDGILLDYKNIKNNHGLRALAKLMLNSFWGKFGQRSNMPQIKYVSEPAGRSDNALGKMLMESIILTRHPGTSICMFLAPLAIIVGFKPFWYRYSSMGNES
jgi:hypothetical protein